MGEVGDAFTSENDKVEKSRRAIVRWRAAFSFLQKLE
jgi:hypothetical protein